MVTLNTFLFFDNKQYKDSITKFSIDIDNTYR